MIQFAEEGHRQQIVEIWQKCFGDRESEIEHFLSVCGSHMRILINVKEDRIAGFLCLLSSTLQLADAPDLAGNKSVSYPAEYIYAVATNPDFRRQGVSTDLLAYVYSLLSFEKKCGILVPANKELELFYQKRGFVNCFTEKIIPMIVSDSSVTYDIAVHPCSVCDTTSRPRLVCDTASPESAFSIRELSVQEYILLRSCALNGVNHLKLRDEALAHGINSCITEGFSLKSIMFNGKEYAFLYMPDRNDENAVYIQETTALESNEMEFIVAVFLRALGKQRARLRLSYPALGIHLPKGAPFDGCINIVLD